MEKLTELLNEYEGTVNNHYYYYWGIDGDYISSDVSGTDHTLDKDEASVIIKSKEYGFIKWLVDNDKIDYTQLEGYSLWETVKNDGWTNYICLLMVLAVSDNPIEFLVSILK